MKKLWVLIGILVLFVGTFVYLTKEPANYSGKDSEKQEMSTESSEANTQPTISGEPYQEPTLIESIVDYFDNLIFNTETKSRTDLFETLMNGE